MPVTMHREQRVHALLRHGAHGDRPALIAADRFVSHEELVVLVDRCAATLPPVRAGRRLVQLAPRADLAGVVAYLAVLEAGHVALVTPPDPHPELLARYRPDVVLAETAGTPAGPDVPGEPFRVLTDGPVHLLHPDLALLLSTSGSTGSPKLVRLSHDNLRSNADAIAAGLGLRPGDRAISSLPLHYCFGLSVLHSHLRAGASVVLHDGRITEPAFWEAMATHRVTTLAVTPYLLDLADSVHGLDRQLPDLRLVTQAGGGLGEIRVRDVEAYGRARGWQLAVMYGQTEATARIAILPPGLAATFPDTVGWPVAGASIRLDCTVPEAADRPGAGEIVVSGPGVMLGYAEHADDLAIGRMTDELRTGDLGTVDAEGLVRVVGRRSGFVKVMGLRIDLHRVESALGAAGLVACVTGDDAGLLVTVEGADAAATTARRVAAEACGLAPASVTVRAVDALPRTANGKVDRDACAGLARELWQGLPDDPPNDGSKGVAVAVTAALRPVLGRPAIDLDRSFVQQGGDSFTHVEASLRLERLLGALPRDWHHQPLRRLVDAARPQPRSPSRQRSRARLRDLFSRQTVETSVLLRAVAAIMICGSHVQVFNLPGGAHVLLAVAGYNFARFVLDARAAERVRRSLRIATGIVVPTVLVAGVMWLATPLYDWATVLLVHWLVAPSLGNVFWFVEALLVAIAFTVGLLAIPPVARLRDQNPWAWTMVLCAAALVPRFVVLATTIGPVRGLPWTVYWLVAVGLALAAARTRGQRLATLALASAGLVGFFPVPHRNLTILIGLALLALLPSVRLPRVLVAPVGVLAAASLHIYVMQFQVFGYLPANLAKFAAGIVAGLLLWWLLRRPTRWLQNLVPDPPQPTNHEGNRRCVAAPC